MRQDPTARSDSFSTSDLWRRQRHIDVLLAPRKDGRVSPEGYRFESNSLSGHERNRLFLRGSKNFADLSLLSGVDDLDDARSFSLLDYDRDGWVDIALLALDTPRFKLYRNRLSDFHPENRSLRLRLVGAQRGARASTVAGNRDAVGARALITFTSGRKILLQKQFGEGFASQNSEVLTIGCPTGDTVARIDATWLSGRRASVEAPDLSEILSIEEPAE